MAIERSRIGALNDAAPRQDRKYVLYWAQMNRRVSYNQALLYAVELANKFGLPVLYYEALTCSYPYANDRLHTFVLQGVPETARRLEKAGIGYCFYLRKRNSDRNDVFYELARQAAAIVTDDYPTFIARGHNNSVPAKLDIPYYAVDASCIVPMGEYEKREYAAYTIRPRIHRKLPQFLVEPDALKVKHRYSGSVPSFHTEVTADNIGKLVAACEIDHSVKPSIAFDGGALAAEMHLKHFLEKNLFRYAKDRNDPAEHATSDMSPYLHFGQISSLYVALQAQNYAKEHKLIVPEYLEELIVRRELSFNYSRFVENPQALENVPDWAQRTMKKHLHDPRPHVYTREQFELAQTGDPIWNATQKEMLLRGKIQGYFRMYWGKKMIEWSASYQEALDTMIYLHDRYAIDGRDPNTYTNILWCFGLHDRAWGDRPVFGNLRTMTSEGLKRKTNIKGYLDEIKYIEETGKELFRIEQSV